MKAGMLIKEIKFTPLKLPLDKPLVLKKTMSNGNIVRQEFTYFDVWVCEVLTNNGAYGQAFTYSIPYEEGCVLYQDVKKYYFHCYLQKDICHISEHTKMAFDKIPHGSSRYINYFLSSIDIACWDIFLKSQESSLSTYLGIKLKEFPMYGSCGWLFYSDDELLRNCEHFLKKGIKAYKVQIGNKNDYERLSLLRKNFGNEFKLLVDANQGYSLAEAIDKCIGLEEFSLGWIEEPIKGDSDEILQALAEQISIPIATGENRLTTQGINKLPCLDVDYVQPDIVRCGGISAIIDIAQVCHKRKKCLVMHLNHVYAISMLLPAVTHEIEYAPFFEGKSQIFTHNFEVTNGCLQVPEGHGTNVYIRQRVIDQFRY